MGYVTIEEGEQALLYNAQGQGQLILGPRRVSKYCRIFNTVFINRVASGSSSGGSYKTLQQSVAVGTATLVFHTTNRERCTHKLPYLVVVCTV